MGRTRLRESSCDARLSSHNPSEPRVRGLVGARHTLQRLTIVTSPGLDQFPTTDTLQFYVPTAPVSLQASSARKASLRQAVQASLGNVPYLLLDDVRLSIDWLVNPEERYETDASADVDNIVKPILDALCGPKGVLINDCQVQRCDVLWRDRFDLPESLELTIRFEEDVWCPKKELIFVEFGRGLAFPLSKSLPGRVVATAEHVLKMFANRDRANAEFSDRHGRYLQPIQRVFHVSRVQEFPCFTLDELRLRFPVSSQ
jgi:Holliday junction resolvase RusA-like endonuclease